MSKDKGIILRIQSPEGTKRIEINESDYTCTLYELVHNVFNLNNFTFALYKERNGKNEIFSSRSKTVRNCGLRHGDMIYLLPLNGAILFNTTTTATSSSTPTSTGNNTPSGEPIINEPIPSTSSSNSSSNNSRPGSSSLSNTMKSNSNIKEDDVDLQLYKMDGKIERERDPKLCRHNNNSRCVHCSSLEPYNEKYLLEHNIKHLSFHSYLRKLMSGVDKGKFLSLDDISCRIKNGCKDHPPWPKGICSKCQPNAITLNRQIYRHIDNITFENKTIVERFLNYWRITGQQRIGYLYGTYELHNDVPLGIKANVLTIYEPPQENNKDMIKLLNDNNNELVQQLANSLGLRFIGWIFTDLIPDNIQKGTVKHLRNIDTYFLSSEECIMAGYYQNLYPNPCRYASNGSFGSKFVTVCVTGDKTNQVHMEGYQVSNQCMALVRDNCLLPTKDAPELGYVRESSDKQYVPDVYYKEKDSYGNEVSRLARPLPVEYLLVDIPASTPVTPHYTFNKDETKEPFPIENRLIDGEIQDFNALSHYLSQFDKNEFFIAINDFHLLLYIATMDMLPMKEYMGPLLDAIKNQDKLAADEWAKSEHWATVEQLIAASSPPNSRPGSVASGNQTSNRSSISSGPKWTCPFCTFLNNSEIQNCEMCNLPRSSRPH